MGSQLTISELLSEIKKGDLILPEFQRGYVWNNEQVKEYMASLYRGHPTGSFLIWKTPNPGLTRGGGQDAGGIFQLILDGQQRLTSVYTLFHGHPPPFYEGEKLFFNLWFNVLTEEFSYYRPIAMKGTLEWIPVTPFLQQGLGPYLMKAGEENEAQRDFLLRYLPTLTRLDQVRSYTYYLDLLGELEMDEVVRIFNLVNSKGTPLTKADLALSHICAAWPEARQVMRATQQELRGAGFDFDLTFFVRCTAAVATGSGTLEPVYKVPVEDVKAAWERTKRSLEYLVNVLKSDLHMDSGDSLTSQNVIVPLVVFLSRNKGRFEDEAQKRAFLHWMLAALMWSRYGGPTETRLTQDIQALDAPSPTERLLENIIADRGRLKVEGRDLIGASWRTAWWSLAYVVARSRGARDWFNGQEVHGKLMGRSNAVEYHHIFPQDLLYLPKGPYNSRDAKGQQRVNEIANLAFMTSSSNKEISNKPPSAYLPLVQEKYPGALAAQSVPENSALWDLDRYEDFLAERRERLASSINDFMDSFLKGQRRVAVRTITDYIAGGESDEVEFKGSLRWDHRQMAVNKELTKVVAKTIAGFMNAKGGTLVIGVSDEGEVWGIEADYPTLGSHKDRDGWQQSLVSALTTYLSAPIAAMTECSFAEQDGRTVAVVHADPWNKPVYLSDNGNTEFYVRAGNTTQRLGVEDTVTYIKNRFPAVYA